jgi:phenylacetate-CoA ligase
MHAYKNVLYYRRLFDENGIDPREVRSVRDLTKVPVTSRADLQKLGPEELTARGLDLSTLIEAETSGSSGQPLVIRRTWKEQMLLHAFLVRANRFLGLRASDYVVGIGLMRPSHHQERKALGKTVRKFGVFRNTRIDAALEPQVILAKLKEVKPDVITGYPSVLDHVAGLMNEESRKVVRPRFLMSGAEILTLTRRNRISKGFEAPVFDVYSSVEFHNIAWECRDTGEMHTSDDSVIVEVLNGGRPANPGEEGEVVGTALHSYAMPLIRYRLGDIVTRGSDRCSCGAPYATIRKVQGRVGDYVQLPAGRMVHVAVLDQAIRANPTNWVYHYQIVQERLHLIVVKVVAAATPPPEALAAMRDSVKEVLGRDVEAEVRLVDEIQSTRGSKQAIFRSKF